MNNFILLLLSYLIIVNSSHHHHPKENKDELIKINYEDQIRSSLKNPKEMQFLSDTLKDLELDTKKIISNIINNNIAIYRLIGNDMPPLQTRGQLRLNTDYALNYERQFPGAVKKWILNRIWNETEFQLIYDSLINHGVNKDDIILRCFDINDYYKATSFEDKLLYLTSQNEARDEGIDDGKLKNYEWSVILDGNTFITYDSYLALFRGLIQASKKGLTYYKVPYHRVHSEQSESWLNSTTTIKELIQNAPIKGESQIAFHKNAKESFSLGDTNQDNKDKGKVAKGYGQRNKSYLFKEGQVCGPDSTKCYCAHVIEASEESFTRYSGKKAPQISNGLENIINYSTSCGIVLRLWSYPSDDVITSGLDPIMEKGFFCFLLECEKTDCITRLHPLANGFLSACVFVRIGVDMWLKKNLFERLPYMINSTECKREYEPKFLSNSCFRSQDREIAELETFLSIEIMRKNQPPGYQTYCQKNI